MEVTVSTLPAPVRAVLIDDRVGEINQQLHQDFALSEEQYGYMLDGILSVVLKKLSVIDFPGYIEKMPQTQQIDLKNLTLRIAIERFWPLQDYLGSVDTLIMRLGGKVPEHQPLPKVEEEEKPVKEGWTQGSARDILQQYKQYQEYYITQKPIRDSDGRLKAPTVTNWLADYLHSMGAEGTDSLKRSQYLAKGSNVQRLNDSEKRNLLNFLVSYEQGDDMFWQVAEGQFLIVEPELPEELKEAAEREQSTRQMSDLVEYYRNVQNNYQAMLEKKKRDLGFEVADNTRKLADIAWDSLGIVDTERCMAAFDMLIDRHALWDILKTDHRFKGIFSRLLDAKYGTEAKTFWNGDLTAAVALTLFWRLILVEKLLVDENKAAIIADYFNRKLGQKERPAYLDLKLGRFTFREVAYKDRALHFV